MLQDSSPGLHHTFALKKPDGNREGELLVTDWPARECPSLAIFPGRTEAAIVDAAMAYVRG